MLIFQLTTSQGGRRLLQLKILLQDSAFQLTTSQGGRLMVQLSRYRYQHISTHDLTRRSTFRSLKMLYHHLYFNSRPHKEVDLLRQYKQTTHTYFNSRPHKEVDSNFYTKSFPFKITFCAHCI